MKKLALVIVSALLLTACDTSGEYDGEYSCKFSDFLNQRAEEKGGRFFPPGTSDVRVVLKDNAFTVYGFSDGEYKSDTMRKLTKSEREQYKDGKFEDEDQDEYEYALRNGIVSNNEGKIASFSPSGNFFTILDKNNDIEYSQQLVECVKK